jgi:hypothetical protein
VGAADGGGDEVRSVNEAEAWEMRGGRGHRGARSMAMGRRRRRARRRGRGHAAFRFGQNLALGFIRLESLFKGAFDTD